MDSERIFLEKCIRNILATSGPKPEYAIVVTKPYVGKVGLCFGNRQLPGYSYFHSKVEIPSDLSKILFSCKRFYYVGKVGGKDHIWLVGPKEDFRFLERNNNGSQTD